MNLGLVGLPSDPSVRVDVHAFEDSCGPGFGALVLIHGNLNGTKDGKLEIQVSIMTTDWQISFCSKFSGKTFPSCKMLF